MPGKCNLKTNITDVPPRTKGHELPLGTSLFTGFLCILFGANVVAVKIGLTGLGIFTAAGIRFGVAATLIFLWARFTGKPLAINRQQAGQLAILGLIFFTQMSLFSFGLFRTTASHGALLGNLLPFVVMVLAHFFIPGDTINVKKITGLLLGFTGVLVLFFDRVTLTGDVLQGDLLVLMAVIAWGCNVVYIKKIIAGLSPFQVTLYPMLITAPIFLLFGFYFDTPMVTFIDGKVITAMLYQTVVTTTFGFVAWNTLISRFGATTLHSFIFLMPISGVFWGITLLNEPITANLIISIVLVVIALIVVNRVEPERSI